MTQTRYTEQFVQTLKATGDQYYALAEKILEEIAEAERSDDE